MHRKCPTKISIKCILVNWITDINPTSWDFLILIKYTYTVTLLVTAVKCNEYSMTYNHISLLSKSLVNVLYRICITLSNCYNSSSKVNLLQLQNWLQFQDDFIYIGFKYSQNLLSQTRLDCSKTSRCLSIRDIKGKILFKKSGWVRYIHFMWDISV